MFYLLYIITCLAGIAIGVFFLLTQQKTLDLIKPANRQIAPGQVWLQLIPLFGLVWQFIVITRLSDSLKNELASRPDLATTPKPATNDRPTYKLGMTYAILFCCGIIPILGIIAALGGVVAWIMYWVQLAGFKKQLEQTKVAIAV